MGHRLNEWKMLMEMTWPEFSEVSKSCCQHCTFLEVRPQGSWLFKRIQGQVFRVSYQLAEFF